MSEFVFLVDLFSAHNQIDNEEDHVGEFLNGFRKTIDC